MSDQEANRLRVLKAIRRTEPVSRTDLTAMTGLASATITSICSELVGRGVLLETRSPPTGKGRPRVLLHLNPDAAYVLGAFLLPTGSLRVEISNARGDRLFEMAAPLGRPSVLEGYVDVIAATIESAIAQSEFDKAQIHSVGLGIPGVVDSPGGRLLWLQSFTPRSLPLGEMLAARLSLPVTIDNSVNIVARAEHWFGEGRQVDDFTLVAVGLGVGLGEYRDGALRHGAHGVNSEFSHIKVVEEGSRCTCGGRGCLTTVASVYGIVARICEARGRKLPDPLSFEAMLNQFADEAREGDSIARQAFERAGRVLGAAVANHITTSDPARVVVFVLNPALGELIAEPFRLSVRENTLPVLRDLAPVEFKVVEEARYSKGAAALVLEQLYRSGAG